MGGRQSQESATAPVPASSTREEQPVMVPSLFSPLVTNPSSQEAAYPPRGTTQQTPRGEEVPPPLPARPFFTGRTFEGGSLAEPSDHDRTDRNGDRTDRNGDRTVPYHDIAQQDRRHHQHRSRHRNYHHHHDGSRSGQGRRTHRYLMADQDSEPIGMDFDFSVAALSQRLRALQLRREAEDSGSGTSSGSGSRHHRSRSHSSRSHSRNHLSSSLPAGPFFFVRPVERKSRCPVCRKEVQSGDLDAHIVMCMTKPRVDFNEDRLLHDAGECTICLEDMRTGDPIARLPCLCVYHIKCLKLWYERSQTCPEHPEFVS